MNRKTTFFLFLLMTLEMFIGPVFAQPLDKGSSPESKKAAVEEKEQQAETDNKITLTVSIGPVHEYPSIDSIKKFRLKKGDIVSVIGKKGDWYLVKLEDGRTGWVNQSLFFKSHQAQVATIRTFNPKSALNKTAESQKIISLHKTDEPRPKVSLQSANKQLMSLNYVDVDIRQALSALAIVREINIAMAKDVSGKVSAHLYQVTLEQALDAITMAGGFSYHKHAGLYYVYKPKEPRDPQAEKLQMRIFKLKYAEVEKVQDILDAIPGMRVIKIHEPSKTIIVEDIPENIQKIEKIISHWDTMPKKVMIEAKILEISLTDDMSLGVNWEKILGDVRIGAGGFSAATMATAEGISPVPATGAGIFANIITGAGSRHQFTAALNALQKKTRVNMLSTPKILAIHGKKARVQVGGQQGYEVAIVSEGVVIPDVKFIDTGTILEITPYIDDKGNVLLNVKPEIKSAVIEGGIPVVKTTVVSTWLLAKNGETVFIGGLIQDTKTKTRERIPCLGSIPGLGVLFGRTLRSTGKSELVILITPHILYAELKRTDQEAIEKTKKIEEDFKKEPLPSQKQLFEFFSIPSETPEENQ